MDCYLIITPHNSYGAHAPGAPDRIGNRECASLFKRTGPVECCDKARGYDRDLSKSSVPDLTAINSVFRKKGLKVGAAVLSGERC